MKHVINIHLQINEKITVVTKNKNYSRDTNISCDHYPPWFIKGELKAIGSSIMEHLVDSEHKISPDSAFRVI